MPKSTAACNHIIAVIQVPVATASYGPSSTLASNEAAYTNYVRQTVARTTGGWTAPSGGATSNVAPIEYPQCGVTGANLTSAASGKGPGAGEVWHYGDLNAPIAVSNQIQPRFPAGAVTITET
jgi:hypothetical protein